MKATYWWNNTTIIVNRFTEGKKENGRQYYNISSNNVDEGICELYELHSGWGEGNVLVYKGRTFCYKLQGLETCRVTGDVREAALLLVEAICKTA